MDAAQALASDRFISHRHLALGRCSRDANGWASRHTIIIYTRRPATASQEMGNAQAGSGRRSNPRNLQASAAPARRPARGAVHSAEIEYAMGNLGWNTVYAHDADDDYQVSKVMREHFANFIKTGDPNGQGRPELAAVQYKAETGHWCRYPFRA
jgi:para-nitrobenzyl esterase